VNGKNYKDKSDEKKLNKEEIELLLKKGILGFLQKEHGHENPDAVLKETDIDEFLKNNSHIAKFSLINGTYTVSK